MKRLVFLLFISAFAAVFPSCETKYGSGEIITVQKSVPEFNAVSISGNINAELRNGPQKVVIEADDNLMEFIRTDVEGNKLKISTEIKSLRDAHIRVYITAPGINRVSTSAGAELALKDDLSSPERIQLVTSSAGEIEGRVDAPFVELDASSGSEIKVKGRTRNLQVDASSGADVEASGLMAENTEVSASSGSAAKVHASVSLKASASSGAGIKYRGGGETTINQSSGGTVKKLN